MVAVTVVIPAYNAGRTFPDTFRSVLAQTFTDYEVVIVNDGSTDDSPSLIAALIAGHSDMRIVTQPNGGLAAARNRGLAEARGRYVAFLDADDIWHPRFLELLAGALDREPQAPFSYGFFHRIDEANRLIPTPRWTYIPRHDFVGLLSMNSVGSGSAAVFRREAVVEAGGFDTSFHQRGLQGAEDWKLSLTLAARHPPVLVPRYLLCYRLSTTSMSQRDPLRQLRAVQAVVADVRSAFPQVPARHFANGRTLINGWLLPAFVRKHDWSNVVRLLFESYVLNPFWFRSRDLRAIHRQKIMSILQDRAGRSPLADFVEDGTRPYAFLGSDRPAPPAPAFTPRAPARSTDAAG